MQQLLQSLNESKHIHVVQQRYKSDVEVTPGNSGELNANRLENLMSEVAQS